jgi:5-methylthioribose kinase
MSTYDLTSAAGVLSYLDAKYPSYSGTHAKPLSGGNANFVFRIFLKDEIDIDGAKQSTIVLKHAAPYSASSEEFPLPVERQVRDDPLLL